MQNTAPFLELGATILVLGLLARVSHRIGVSAIPLFLLVGLFFGRGGALDLGFSDPFLQTSSEIGAVLLLLLLGLEYSAAEVLRNVRAQGSAPYLDIVLNALPGAAIGLLLGWGAVGAVTMAGVTYISSSSVVALVVRELGWRRNPETGRVVGLLVFEDLVMAPYLPALTAVVSGAGVVAGLLSVGTAAVVVLVTFLLALRGAHWMSGLLDPKHPLSLVLLVLGAALTAAGLAAFVGVSAAVAAFLVGLLVSGEVAQQARQALSPLRDLFAALFFLFFGLSVDPGAIPQVLAAGDRPRGRHRRHEARGRSLHRPRHRHGGAAARRGAAVGARRVLDRHRRDRRRRRCTGCARGTGRHVRDDHRDRRPAPRPRRGSPSGEAPGRSDIAATSGPRADVIAAPRARNPHSDPPRSRPSRRERAPDHHALHLVRALDDLQHLRLAQVPLDREVLDVAVAAEHLHGVGGHPHGGVGGEQLGLGRLDGERRARRPAPRGLQVQRPGRGRLPSPCPRA